MNTHDERGVEMAARWRGLLAALGLRDPGERVFADLVRRYAEPHRHYHTLAHLRGLLREWERCPREAIRDPAAIEAAIWFHDAVYTMGDPDNEARSADLAREALGRLGLAAAPREAVARLVLATDHRAPPAANDPDAATLVDLDLSILGQPAEAYERYAAGIRAEAGLSETEFQNKRAAFLRQMLTRPALYLTPAFRARFEATARDQLRRELRGLESG